MSIEAQTGGAFADPGRSSKKIRLTFAWRFVLIRIAGYYQEGRPEGEELLELVAAFLEQSPVDVADFIAWEKKETPPPDDDTPDKVSER